MIARLTEVPSFDVERDHGGFVRTCGEESFVMRMAPTMPDRARIGVLIFGPRESSNAAFGGGRGGIISAMEAMCQCLLRLQVPHAYCGYSVRTRSRQWFLMLPARLLADVVRLTCMLGRKLPVLHVVADGPYGVYRTLLASLLAKVAFRALFIDVRGNNLDAYSKREESWPQSLAWKMVIRLADAVLVQSRSTCESLRISVGSKVMHHPNWIRAPFRPPHRNILTDETIRVIYAGFVYESKGALDLVVGCALACERGVRIELTLVGQEDESCGAWLDRFAPPPGLVVHRRGRQPRDGVLTQLALSDIFVFPSYHPGEGHPNAVNEAAASGLAIVTTRVGTIGEFLDSESAYFVAARSASGISDVLQHIGGNRSQARAKARRAQEVVLREFSEARVLGALLDAYGRSANRR